MSIEILEDEILPPQLPKQKMNTKTASLYKDALQESRNMHASFIKKLQTIETQNKEILEQLDDIARKLNSPQNYFG